MEASSPPPPPTVSEYDADADADAVPAANRDDDDVTTDGKFGRPRRSRRGGRHLLRILLVLAQCYTERERGAPVTYLARGTRAMPPRKYGGGQFHKTSLRIIGAPRSSLPLISAGRRMHFGIMGSPRPPSSVHSHGACSRRRRRPFVSPSERDAPLLTIVTQNEETVEWAGSKRVDSGRIRSQPVGLGPHFYGLVSVWSSLPSSSVGVSISF